ncbi:MAG: NAD(P)/FAD-dependent oxidoreductase [Candidatus Cyclobacteriaceae bacterium M2_1C_046]
MSIKRHIAIPSTDLPRVVILGGGFGGITFLKKLKGQPYQVVLIDRNNYHTFQPLLYQVATAGLEPDAIAGPLRKQMGGIKNFHFRMAEVFSVDQDKKLINTEIGELSYDYLVIATGSKTNYYGNASVAKYALPLKQIPQALDFRSHILQNFEKAILTEDPVELEALMTIVIVGGGPTGVEVAGALGEIKKNILPVDYPELDLSQMKIILLEGLPNLLSGMSESSSKKALKYLKNFDVDVRLQTLVKDYDGVTAKLNNGEEIKSYSLIWAAGVMGNIPKGFNDDQLERSRLLVDQYCRVKDTHYIYAMGDVAMMKTKKFPAGHPMLAPVAMQQGRLLGDNFVNMAKGKEISAFKFRDKGAMATIGRNKAVVDLPGIRFGGLFAWIIWMFIHLVSIIGFRNKMVVFSNWVWNYFTYDKGNRLIIRKFKPIIEQKKNE